jgi:ribosomal protein S27E
MNQILKCNNCGHLLAELVDGQMKSLAIGVRVAKNTYAENLAWAMCGACHHETPLFGPFLKLA